jgi:hypothetical protein
MNLIIGIDAFSENKNAAHHEHIEAVWKIHDEY